MTWVLFSILASILFTAGSLLSRHLLKSLKDPWAYSFWFSFGGALICLPLFLLSPSIPMSWLPWLLVVVMGGLVVAHNLLLFTALHYIEVSVSGSIMKLRLVWVYILGALFLNEPATPVKLIGICLIIAAAFFVFHKFKQKNSLKGIVLVLVASIFNATGITLVKYLLGFFNSVSLTFFAGFLASAVINMLIMPKFVQRATRIIKERGRLIFLSAGLGGFANLLFNKALELGEATRVVLVVEAFLIITLVGESMILKEKDRLWVKAVAVMLATAGAVLVSISR